MQGLLRKAEYPTFYASQMVDLPPPPILLLPLPTKNGNIDSIEVDFSKYVR